MRGRIGRIMISRCVVCLQAYKTKLTTSTTSSQEDNATLLCMQARAKLISDDFIPGQLNNTQRQEKSRCHSKAQ
jgi:hypothetical protein